MDACQLQDCRSVVHDSVDPRKLLQDLQAYACRRMRAVLSGHYYTQLLQDHDRYSQSMRDCPLINLMGWKICRASFITHETSEALGLENPFPACRLSTKGKSPMCSCRRSSGVPRAARSRTRACLRCFSACSRSSVSMPSRSGPGTSFFNAASPSSARPCASSHLHA